MAESFIFSFNIIAPIFLIVALGALLNKLNFFNDGFLAVCDKLVFKICLPCLLFQDIVTTDISTALNIPLILFCIAAVTVAAFLPCAVLPIFIKDKAKCGAFAQSIFRSNSAILGVTLASNMFGNAGLSVIAMVLPFVVVLFNVYAVVVLSIFAPREAKLSARELVVHIIKTVVTNPLIIAVALAFLWRLLPVGVPTFVDKGLTYLSDMAMPISLISLGASFSTSSLKGRLGLAIAASTCRTVIVPLIAVGVAVLLGFRNESLGVVLIVLGGPSAVSSYIMAKQMKSDHHLTGQILLISTLMCLFTLFLGIVILKETGLI